MSVTTSNVVIDRNGITHGDRNRHQVAVDVASVAPDTHAQHRVVPNPRTNHRWRGRGSACDNRLSSTPADAFVPGTSVRRRENGRDWPDHGNKYRRSSQKRSVHRRQRFGTVEQNVCSPLSRKASGKEQLYYI